MIFRAVDTNILKHFTQPGTPQYTECSNALKSLRVRGERVATFSQCAVEFLDI